VRSQIGIEMNHKRFKKMINQYKVIKKKRKKVWYPVVYPPDLDLTEVFI